MKKAFLSLCLVLMLMFPVQAGMADEMITISLSDEQIIANSEGVTVSGSVVTISQPGEYLLSGTLTNGQVVVDCTMDGKVTLYLNGVSIHNEKGPAILVGECTPRAVISLVDQSENTLSNGSDLTLDKNGEPYGVIFSKSDLTLSGNGALKITSGALDGIASKDDLVIKNVTLMVNAVRHGLRGKDSVEIKDADLTVVCGKDGIRATNTKDQDRGYIKITDGTVRITCGDDALYYVTSCTVSGTQLEVSIVK